MDVEPSSHTASRRRATTAQDNCRSPLKMSDRIAIFNNGRIVQIGSPAELYERPDNLFVAGFLGRSNVLPATVRNLHSDGRVVEYEGGSLHVIKSATSYRPGHKVNLVIRPHQLCVADHHETALNVTVTAVSYVGNIVNYLLISTFTY